MYTNSINHTLKMVLDTLKEPTVHNLSSHDKEFNNIIKKEMAVFSLYDNLDLTTQQRELIDKCIEARNNSNMDYATLCYLAGIIDTIQLLNNMGMLQSNH